MLALVGIKDAMQLAYDMGITSWEPTSENMRNVGLSLVLGGRETTLLQEVTAYGVFADQGVRHDPVSILKIESSKGKKLFEKKDREGEKVLPEDVAFLISHILLDNNARALDFGVNSALRIPGKTVAVKTGTTDEKRDNWTIGYTPSYVVGVWVGNNDNSPMNQKIASGVTGASPIWHDIMTAILKDKPDEEFKKPDTVIAMNIDSFSGGLPVDGQTQRSEYFIKGTEPTTKSPIYQRDFYVFKEDDPVSTDGKNRWQEGIDKWIEEAHQGDSKYHPPDDVKNVARDEPTATPTPNP
jgi:membrane peptidoglycan carboxypeptidase